jgi:hypothetical protein
MKSREPAAVQVAIAEMEAAKADLTTAEKAVEEARKRCDDAVVGLRKARLEADQSMPQCRCVAISRYGSERESDIRMVVILRQTPSGLLVTRPAGEVDRPLTNFVWNKFKGVYREKTANRGAFYASSHLELRDVPAQFLPKEIA